MPEWLVEMWLDEYGRDIAETLLAGLLEVHPVSLRFSTLISEAERRELCMKMRENGVEMRRHPYLPYLFLTGGYAGNPASLPAFSAGKCTVQDVSSALAVEAAEIKDGDFVVDVCAAPGGKSILAAEKAGRGKVLARDISEEKKNITEENICRMGAGNIEVQIFDGTCTDEALLEKADVLLLDVPCSGL